MKEPGTTGRGAPHPAQVREDASLGLWQAGQFIASV